jgi:hypothetical protein
MCSRKRSSLGREVGQLVCFREFLEILHVRVEGLEVEVDTFRATRRT